MARNSDLTSGAPFTGKVLRAGRRFGAFGAALCLSGALVLALAAPAPGPAPELDPLAVVQAQLAALARNDEPYEDAGIALTWTFASPDNRAATGPLARFRTLFENPAYGPMLDHVAARFSEPQEVGESALVGVVLTADDGVERGYLFQLSRAQTADCEGCWMTDSVVPMPVPESAPAPVI